MNSFKIFNLSHRDGELHVSWKHDFAETDNFCVILDQDGSCEFRTTNNPDSILLPGIEPGTYLVKVQTFANGAIQETPGKIIVVE